MDGRRDRGRDRGRGSGAGVGGARITGPGPGALYTLGQLRGAHRTAHTPEGRLFAKLIFALLVRIGPRICPRPRVARRPSIPSDRAQLAQDRTARSGTTGARPCSPTEHCPHSTAHTARRIPPSDESPSAWLTRRRAEPLVASEPVLPLTVWGYSPEQSGVTPVWGYSPYPSGATPPNRLGGDALVPTSHRAVLARAGPRGHRILSDPVKRSCPTRITPPGDTAYSPNQ